LFRSQTPTFIQLSRHGIPSNPRPSLGRTPLPAIQPRSPTWGWHRLQPRALALTSCATMRILLVEDNVALAEWLIRVLREDHFSVDVAHTGTEADNLLYTDSFELVVLDLGLPKMAGMAVLKRLRRRNVETPVLILTADTRMEMRLQGLDI